MPAKPPRNLPLCALSVSALSSPILCLQHSPLSPVFRTFFQVPYPATPCLPLLRKLPGCVPTIPILERAHPEQAQGPLITLRSTQVLSFHILAHSLALFCTLQKLNSFVFKRFRTLHQKTQPPGVRERKDKLLAENNVRISVLTSLLPYVLTSAPYREQHRLGRRTIGNLLELWVLSPQRLRHLHLRALQNMNELQRIDDRLALKMIVGDHKRLPSPRRNFVGARNPWRQLFGGVKIVVAFMRRDRRIVAEPRVVASPVQPHVPDGRGSLSRRPQRSPYDGLVDVAETDAAGAQQLQRLRRIP